MCHAYTRWILKCHNCSVDRSEEHKIDSMSNRLETQFKSKLSIFGTTVLNSGPWVESLCDWSLSNRSTEDSKLRRTFFSLFLTAWQGRSIIWTSTWSYAKSAQLTNRRSENFPETASHRECVHSFSVVYYSFRSSHESWKNLFHFNFQFDLSLGRKSKTATTITGQESQELQNILHFLKFFFRL